ncbi:MAG TPA: FAD-dependent oxidoreductase [Solirubrobacteraceae bacterium]|jgi:L-aspartate oxidase|nr:FAD-dependent oxidoreductase [Solirubrobacteraceae bacterium]
MVAEHPIEADVAVIGAGATGLYTALTVARAGGRSALISATPLAETASYWAQGGLAAALAENDTPELHLADTLRAGRGVVRPSAAAVLCSEAPERVHDLERLGVRFDADRFGRLALGLEGGHSLRRVVHAGGSATGRRVVRQLSALAAEDARVEVLERARAGRLLATDGCCVGILCEDGRQVSARAVVVCAGGAAALWSRTTNPPGSVGTGMLLAATAGAELADLELVQFHPTAVIGVAGREGFLITEAIRGEGATLQDDDGERFVDELAPRDEVARAIQVRLAATGRNAVWLDMRAIDPALFPNVVTALLDAGVDPTRERIPVAPAAHYVMGGIVTDLDGRTTVAGLYAAGESACTGLHGANRLASNSLSECFVYGRRAALAALAEPVPARSRHDQAVAAAQAAPPHAPIPSPETRAAMWRWGGLERNQEGLEQLLSDPHPLARAVAACALARRETRGAQVRSDWPELDPDLDLQHAVIAPGSSDPRFQRWT